MKIADIDAQVLRYRSEHGHFPKEVRLNPADVTAVMREAFQITNSPLQTSEILAELNAARTDWYRDKSVFQGEIKLV